MKTGYKSNQKMLKPVCLGSGLVTLDVIYDGKYKDPQFFAGGSCCNVLTILAYLGWTSYPMARLGKDPEGDRIINDIKRWKVKTEFVERDYAISTSKIIEHILNDCGTPHHKFYFKCKHGIWLPRRRPFLLKSLQSIQDMLPQSNVFYFDRADPSALKTAKMLKVQGTVIMFEPPRILQTNIFLQCLQVADIVKYNHIPSHESKYSQVNIPLEIHTKGEEGLLYRARFLGHDDWVEMKAIPISKVIDAAGSGDWLTAGLIHSLCHGGSRLASSKLELQRSLLFGQALASLNCSFVGARGMMYSVKSSDIFSLADKLIRGIKPSRRINYIKPKLKAYAESSACRVCLCSSSE